MTEARVCLICRQGRYLPQQYVSEYIRCSLICDVSGIDTSTRRALRSTLGIGCSERMYKMLFSLTYSHVYCGIFPMRFVWCAHSLLPKLFPSVRTRKKKITSEVTSVIMAALTLLMARCPLSSLQLRLPHLSRMCHLSLTLTRVYIVCLTSGSPSFKAGPLFGFLASVGTTR